MKSVRIIPVVEGAGECHAVPVLIRRIALDIDPGFVPEVLSPLRVPAAKLKQADELDRTLKLAALKLNNSGGILILVDCDDGCPAQEGPELLERVQKIRPDLAISVVLAKKEYEAWFIAAAESLRSKRDLPNTLSPPTTDPEEIRGAKEWLTHQMPQGRRYSETTDQAALTAVFDMNAARSANSFDKCYREVHRMLSRLRESLMDT